MLPRIALQPRAIPGAQRKSAPRSRSADAGDPRSIAKQRDIEAKKQRSKEAIDIANDWSKSTDDPRMGYRWTPADLDRLEQPCLLEFQEGFNMLRACIIERVGDQ